MQGLEASLIGYTLWNYTPDNSNVRGDLWNDEDFSLFSPDQIKDNDGCRGIQAAVRPYARAVAGTPVRQSFDYKTGDYIFEYRSNPEIAAPTEIFVPRVQYPNGFTVNGDEASGDWNERDQILLHHPERAQQTFKIHLERRVS
jgi:hypothetical protein